MSSDVGVVVFIDPMRFMLELGGWWAGESYVHWQDVRLQAELQRQHALEMLKADFLEENLVLHFKDISRACCRCSST